MKAVTVDAEGTLIHPYPSVGRVYSEALARHGFRASADELERAFRTAFKKTQSSPRDHISNESEKRFWHIVVRRTLGKYCSGEDFEDLFEELYERFGSAEHWRLTEGAVQALEAVKESGYRLQVLSNWDARLRKVLCEMGLNSLFERYFISCEIGFEKPDPRIFSHVEEVLELHPHEIVHVGNSVRHDAQGALAAGWNSVLVGTVSVSGLPDCLVIAELKDLPHILPNRTHRG